MSLLEQPRQSLVSNGRRALVVEDDADDAALIRRVLTSSGLVQYVTIMRDGPTAMSYLQHSGIPSAASIIVLDLKMPGMDGVEMLQHVRSRPETRYTPVIVLTSSDEPADVSRCYASGASSYVRKPVDYKRFREVIESLFTYWLCHNQPIHGSRGGDES